MSKPSPVGTVMINAARAAGRSLARDFGEVENLQVSKKGPADFVSNADHRAEQIIFDALTKARPGYGFVMEERGIVEGTVRAAASVRNTYYLNFGTDWKTDFTIGIPSDIRRTMSAHGIDLALFPGRRVRVHGWLESYNGPYIELFSPAWIEVLPDESQSSTLPAENN